MAATTRVRHTWRNRLIVAGAGAIGVCVCLGAALAGMIAQAPAATASPTIAATEPATDRPKEPAATRTVETIILVTSSAPTRTPVRETATSRLPSRTPTNTRPPTFTAPATNTRAPAFTATSAPVATQAPLPTQEPPTQPPPTAAPTQAPVPTQAPAGIVLVSLSSPISAGSDASLVVQVAPGAACFLSYRTPSGTDSSAQGLGAATANGEGRCGWSWRIGSNTNPGTGHLFVSSGGANATFDIVIQ